MLFGLSGGGRFRAVAGLEASLKLASSGLVAILSATIRVCYPDNSAMVRKNGSRPCLSKRSFLSMAATPYFYVWIGETFGRTWSLEA